MGNGAGLHWKPEAGEAHARLHRLKARRSGNEGSAVPIQPPPPSQPTNTSYRLRCVCVVAHHMMFIAHPSKAARATCAPPCRGRPGGTPWQARWWNLGAHGGHGAPLHHTSTTHHPPPITYPPRACLYGSRLRAKLRRRKGTRKKAPAPPPPQKNRALLKLCLHQLEARSRGAKKIIIILVCAEPGENPCLSPTNQETPMPPNHTLANGGELGELGVEFIKNPTLNHNHL